MVTTDTLLPGGGSWASAGRAQRVPFSSCDLGSGVSLREPSTPEARPPVELSAAPPTEGTGTGPLPGPGPAHAGAAWEPSSCPGLRLLHCTLRAAPRGLSCHPGVTQWEGSGVRKVLGIIFCSYSRGGAPCLQDKGFHVRLGSREGGGAAAEGACGRAGVCVRMRACTSVCVHGVHMCTGVLTGACVHGVLMGTCVHGCVCAWVCSRVHACTGVLTGACVHGYVCVCVCMHVHRCACFNLF